jgi:hypothetical protein
VLIGAILGAIFGSLLVLFLIWFCCYSPYAPRLNAFNPLYRDDGSDSISSEGPARFQTGFSRTGRRRYSETVEVRRDRTPVRIIVEPRRAERIIVEERRAEERIYDDEPLDREVRPLGRRLDGPDF